MMLMNILTMTFAFSTKDEEDEDISSSGGSGGGPAMVIIASRHKIRHTVLDTTQSVLRDMTIHEYLRHPQGMLFKDITKDMILDMIWIR